MEPANFEGANVVMTAPKGAENLVNPLCTQHGRRKFDNLPVVVSCWKPSIAELEEILRTGRIWLVIAGHNMPPVHLQADQPELWAEPLTPP